MSANESDQGVFPIPSTPYGSSQDISNCLYRPQTATGFLFTQGNMRFSALRPPMRVDGAKTGVPRPVIAVSAS